MRPEASEEVLVVLQGVHQNIPARRPPLQQTTAKMLEPPPETTTSAPVVKAADRGRQDHREISVDRQRTEPRLWRLWLLEFPNFNVKATGETQSKSNQCAAFRRAQTGGKSKPTPAVPVPADTAPSVLGARPSPPKAPAASPATPRNSSRYRISACAAAGSASPENAGNNDRD